MDPKILADCSSLAGMDVISFPTALRLAFRVEHGYWPWEIGDRDPYAFIAIRELDEMSLIDWTDDSAWEGVGLDLSAYRAAVAVNNQLGWMTA